MDEAAGHSGNCPRPADHVRGRGGDGDIIGQTDDGSRVLAAVAGTLFAILPVLVLGALAMTGEYSARTIHTTLTACPRRSTVLAAKATVLGAATFTTGLLATLTALVLTQPRLERQGFEPPVYPSPSLTDPTVLRVVVGTAVALALLAVMSLGAGTILRSGPATIVVVAAAVLLPAIAAPVLPASGITLQRLGPIAGLAVQQVAETDDAFLLPWVGRPWTGLSILAGYAAAGLAGGWWVLRRRDA